MLTYFHGWRRKLGAVMLVIALALFAECARRTQMDWDCICPADWEYVRMFSIAPLTLLSAYLLISKPRLKRKQPVPHA